MKKSVREDMRELSCELGSDLVKVKNPNEGIRFVRLCMRAC